jgi:hypothetical protein
MAGKYERVKECTEQLFDPSPKNPRRKQVARLLPSLKSGDGYATLDKVINRLGILCNGGAYAPGDTFPSLDRDYFLLSEEEREALNRFYLSKIEQFEASLTEP